MNQFNTTIISLVIAPLFQIFSFHNLTCNKRYAAFTQTVKENSENFWDITRGTNIWFNLIKRLVKVFRVWRNNEALKIECNKPNRNIRYAIFRDLNLQKIK